MIQIVPLQIRKETSSDKEGYLIARCSKFEKVLKASAPNRDTTQDESKKQGYLQHLLLLAEGGIADFPLTPLEDSVALASSQSFKEKVEAVFPLIDGETLIEEQIGRAGNHINVKQVTNLSTLCLTDTSVTIAPEETEAVESSAPTVGAVADNAKEEAEALQKVAKTVVDIGKGLVKALPGPYGSILSGVFEGLSTYLSMTSTSQEEKDTENTIKRIGELMGKITWKVNVQQTIKTQAGVVRGIIEGLNDHYAPLKKELKSNDTAKQLVNNYLTPYLRDLDTVIGTLTQSDFDVASLPEFCMAAGAYFCVLQELAVLDEGHRDDPFKSTRCDEIKNIKAPRFIKYVNETYDKIVKTARESVSPATEYKYDLRFGRGILECPDSYCMSVRYQPSQQQYIKYKDVEGVGRFSTGTDLLGAWYYDSGTFESYPDGFAYCGCHTTWAWETCGKARDKWIANKQAKLVSDIENELGSLKSLANQEWEKLKEYPLYGNDSKNW
jgi:molybdopterin converting factor small subunit